MINHCLTKKHAEQISALQQEIARLMAERGRMLDQRDTARDEYVRERDTLKRENAALRQRGERLKNFAVGLDIMLDQHQRGVLPTLDIQLLRDDIREQFEALDAAIKEKE